MARSAEGWRLRRDKRTGIWIVRFRIAGRRFGRSTGERDRRKAEARARDIYLDTQAKPSARGVADPTAALDVLIAEWLVAFGDDGRAGETVTTYEIYAAAHWLPRWSALADLTEAAIADYRRAGLKRALGVTINKELSAIAGFLDWCRERGHIAVVPRIVYAKKHHGVRRATRGWRS